MVKRSPAKRAVTRAEVDSIRQTLDDCCRTLDLQFHRIAQLQAQFDGIATAWVDALTSRNNRSDDDAKQMTDSLRKLRQEAEASKEERRVISATMAERSSEARLQSARARTSATKRSADARNRNRRFT
jgi:hypothetical protein